MSAPHPEVVSRLQHYRATLQEHGHGPTRTTCIFFLFVNNDHQEAVRDARETTRAYTELITSFVPREALHQVPAHDPMRSYLEFILSMPDDVEERAVVGTPAECRRRLYELNDEFGLDQVAFYFHAGARDPQRARQGLELFAKEVMPEFHA